jgi:hypothetical protein
MARNGRRQDYQVFKRTREAMGGPTYGSATSLHTGATMAAQAGAAKCELMDRLGHSTPQAALISQHAASGRQREVAERLSSMAVDARSRGDDRDQSSVSDST